MVRRYKGKKKLFDIIFKGGNQEGGGGCFHTEDGGGRAAGDSRSVGQPLKKIPFVYVSPFSFIFFSFPILLFFNRFRKSGFSALSFLFFQKLYYQRVNLSFYTHL